MLHMHTFSVLFVLHRFSFSEYFITCGFWPRVRALALRAPVFFGSSTHKRDAARPRRDHRSFTDPSGKINDFLRKKTGGKFQFGNKSTKVQI
jgi:hypothetical protein